MLLATITELCRAELNNGQHELADWIEKKSNAAWVSREGARTFIAESEGEILGVGMVDLRGGILLCYVRPDARFFGISKVILKSLDEFARSKHVQKCSLEIT